VALAVRVFDQILQLSSTSQLSLHGARFGREIRPCLASRVRQSLADAEQLRKARDAIDALREMAAEVAAGDEWRYRVDRSVRLRELHRAMGWMLARMPDTLGDIKDFTGDPDRASVGIVAGLLLATLGDVAARELRRATVAAATTPWDSVGAEGGIGVNDGLTVSVGSLRPAYDLPVDPAALATMWTALTAIITVESPPSLPPSPSPHEFAASPVRGDSGSFSLDSGSRPATPVSPSPLMSGASSPRATTPRRRAKCSVESMATLQARVMEPDNHELDAEMGVGVQFSWAARLVAEALAAGAVSRPAGLASPVEMLACWLGGVLAMHAQHAEKAAAVEVKAQEDAAEALRSERSRRKAAAAATAAAAAVAVAASDWPADASSAPSSQLAAAAAVLHGGVGTEDGVGHVAVTEQHLHGDAVS